MDTAGDIPAAGGAIVDTCPSRHHRLPRQLSTVYRSFRIRTPSRQRLSILPIPQSELLWSDLRTVDPHHPRHGDSPTFGLRADGPAPLWGMLAAGSTIDNVLILKCVNTLIVNAFRHLHIHPFSVSIPWE